MTLKSRSTTAIVIAIILIVAAVLVWANQTGRITMFASEENLAAKQGLSDYDQLVAQKIAGEEQEISERTVKGTVENITKDKITLKINKKIDEENITSEDEEYILTDNTIYRSFNESGQFVPVNSNEIKKSVMIRLWLKDDDKTQVEQIDIF